MKIKWLGHSCFLLTAANGVTVLTDPFDSSVGYKVPEVAADIVSTSHEHLDHSYTQAVQGDFVHINQVGSFSHKGIEITGVATFHDGEHGSQRGKNTIYKFLIDGIQICHCGDLGHLLTPAQLQEIGPVDVVLLPVGGFYTIGPDQAVEIINMLQPTLIIPMHFKTPVMQYPIAGVESFLEKIGGGKRVGQQEIEYTKALLVPPPGVVVLEYE